MGKKEEAQERARKEKEAERKKEPDLTKKDLEVLKKVPRKSNR